MKTEHGADEAGTGAGDKGADWTGWHQRPQGLVSSGRACGPYSWRVQFLLVSLRGAFTDPGHSGWGLLAPRPTPNLNA